MLANIIKISVSNGLGPLIQFAATPLMMRVYSPSQFGEYYSLLAWASLGSLFCTGLLQHGIFSQRSKFRARLLYSWCVGVSVIWVLIGVGLGIFCLLGYLNISFYIFIIIIYASIINLQQIIQLYAASLERTNVVSMFGWVRAIFLVTAQLGLAKLINFPDHSLVFFTLLAEAVFTILSIFFVPYPLIGNKVLTFATKNLLLRNIGFFRYFLPAQLASTGINFFPIFAMNYLANSALVGFYGISQRVVQAPIFSFGNAFKLVYWRWWLRKKSVSINQLSVFWMVSHVVSFLGFGVLLVIGYFVDEFGVWQEWRTVFLFVPFILLWSMGSISTMIFSELLKNTGGQRHLFHGEILASFIKLIGFFILWIYGIEFAIVGFCSFAYLATIINSIRYRSVLLKSGVLKGEY